jgi:hypothetical protein
MSWLIGPGSTVRTIRISTSVINIDSIIIKYGKLHGGDNDVTLLSGL